MRNQYISDKEKIYYNLQSKFINSCLFLINKSDTIPKKDDREKIKNNLVKTISKFENNANAENINICFFSGKYFMEFIHHYKIYVETLEKNPFITLEYLYDEWSSDKWNEKNFKNYIINKISDIIEEKFDFDLNKDKNIKIPSDFYYNLKSAFNQLFNYKYRSINSEEEDEIIKKLYCINTEFKNQNFSGTNYSSAFFNKLKEVIIYSDNLQKDNLQNTIEGYFHNYFY